MIRPRLVITRMEGRAYAAPETPQPDPSDAEPYGPEDQKRMLAWWNRVNPEYDGLLDANPAGEQEAAEAREPTPPTGDD